MTRELADVALGGFTVGFVRVELDEDDTQVRLESPDLLETITETGPVLRGRAPCACPPEDLPFAWVQSRHGKPWRLGVKVCAVHRCLRPA